MMAILQWFDTEEIDEFARSIAAELVKRAPPAGLDAHDEKTSKRLRNTHHAVFSRAEQFARTHKLNIYKKARNQRDQFVGPRLDERLGVSGFLQRPPELIAQASF